MKRNLKALLSGALAITMLFASGCTEKANESSEKGTDKKSDTTVTTTTAPIETEKPVVTEGKDKTVHPLENEPQSDITPALWKLETQSGATVYFMGSMHALPDKAYSFPQYVMDAYNSSDAIAVECDTVAFETDLKAQIALSESMMYTDGTSIKDHISTELYNELVKLMKEWDIYMTAYDFFKPAMWESLMDDYLLSQSELKYENAFDTFFLNRAKADGKKIIEVESVEAQMDMLINFSDEINELMLESYAATSVEDYVSQLNDLYEIWSSGDYEAAVEADEIDESLFTQEELDAYADYNKQMMTDRNKIMADKLIELSKGDENVFFYVGLAHFGGDDGIISLLDKAGVKYERIK